MPTPITLDIPDQPPAMLPTTASLTSEQLTALIGAVASSGVIALPEGYTFENVVDFRLTVDVNGKADLNAIFRPE